MRSVIVCELATSHGGDLDVASDLIRAAADSGADLVKLQTYDPHKIHPQDPQRDWLVQAHLTKADHEYLLKVAQQVGIELFSTPFCADSLQMLRDLGLTRFKIASSESRSEWYRTAQGVRQGDEQWIVSYPWGRGPWGPSWVTRLTAIPLYPTPLECVGQATLLEGYSDHGEGIAACQWALAQGARMIEVHVCLPGKSRQKPFDKTPEQVRDLRQFAEQMTTIRSGVNQVFRNRWSA